MPKWDSNNEEEKYITVVLGLGIDSSQSLGIYQPIFDLSPDYNAHGLKPHSYYLIPKSGSPRNGENGVAITAYDEGMLVCEVNSSPIVFETAQMRINPLQRDGKNINGYIIIDGNNALVVTFK